MTTRRIRASAPGTLMIFGEHAVLRGEPALVAAGDLRLTVELVDLDRPQFELRSQLGNWDCSLDHFEPDPRFLFLNEVIRPRLASLSSGLRMTITSAIDQTVGLGSSAAVTVASVAALRTWCNEDRSKDAIFKESLRAVRTVQGRASGADLAAAVEGGIVHYCNGVRRRLHCALPEITLVYSGSKMKTPEVISIVDRAAEQQPERFNQQFRMMGNCSDRAATALEDGNSTALAELFTVGQGVMNAIGVCNKELAELVHQLEDQPGIRAAKISGSGLGDCVVALGHCAWDRTDRPALPVQLSDKGLECCEIYD